MKKGLVRLLLLVVLVSGCTRVPDVENSLDEELPITLDWIHTDGTVFLDSSGRTVILRGFVTITHNGPSIDEVEYTLEDYQRMKLMGANYQSIRIFVGWIGGWPGYTAERKYLEKLDRMVSLGKQVGIYSEFKLTMYDIEGILTDGSVRDKTWGNFWRNEKGEQEMVIEAWKKIWEHYKDDPAVVGYDILNEPHSGDITVGDDFISTYLNPFYQKAIDELRQIDQNHIVFIQPPLASPPVNKKTGDVIYLPYNKPISRSNVAYAPHFYVNIKKYDIERYPALMERYINEAQIHKAPLIIGEFGEFWNASNDGNPEKKVLFQKTERNQIELFDQALVGFSRPWFANDRAVGLGHAVIKGRTKELTGEERIFITDVVARPYPQRTAGRLDSFRFDVGTKQFSLVYEPDTLGATELFIPRERHYKDGFTVKHSSGIILVFDPSLSSLKVTDNPGNVDTERFVWDENDSTLRIDEWLKEESITVEIMPSDFQDENNLFEVKKLIKGSDYTGMIQLLLTGELTSLFTESNRLYSSLFLFSLLHECIILPHKITFPISIPVGTHSEKEEAHHKVHMR